MESLKRFFTILAVLLLLCPVAAHAQRRGRSKEKAQQLVVPIYKDTTKLAAASDSLKINLDSLRVADSLMREDSIRLMKQSSIEFPAFSNAKDSLIEVFENGHRILKYYGEVTVQYGSLSLSADYMRYDIDEQTVYAKGIEDPETGQIRGNPIMKDASQGNKEYEMKELTYNFKTRKAFIKNMITEEAEGIIRGNNIKMQPDNSINITDGKYTVCDCEEPHYYLHMTAAKVITKPNQNTVFGPAWPVVEGVPLFPIVLPFGFVPKTPKSRATGILMPTFGEEEARGFFMRDLGFYIPIGDYFDVSLTGSYYTLGSWAVELNSRYKWRYHFGGNVSLSYSYNQVGIKGEPDFQASTDFKVGWQHSQDSKSRPGTSFSASVNFSSPGNNRYNSHSMTEAMNNQTHSSISYSKNWSGKVNLSVNALHNQNSKDSSYSLSLPNITLSVSKFYPFKRKQRVGKERFYEKFSISYNTSFQNQINFKASELKNNPDIFKKFKAGMKHSFSIGLPNFTLFKYININPSVSYGMNWMFDSKEKFYNEKTGKVEERQGGWFSTFGVTQDYSGSVSADTQIYGTFNFGKHRKIQAMRHIIKPSLSFTYSPDRAKYFNGWRTLHYTDNQGNAQSLDYNIYEGIGTYPGKGSNANLRIQLGNNLEAKVRDLRDTTGTGSKKVKILDQFNISTGYNFLKDSLRMDDVGITVTTNIFGKVGVNGNLNFSPYAVDDRGRTINKFEVMKSGKPLRLTRASFSLSYSVSGKGTINGNDGSKDAKNASGGAGGSNSTLPSYARVYYHPLTGEYIPGGWSYYMNPNAPWSLNMSLNFSYNRSYQYDSKEQILRQKNNITSSLSLSGNIKLTPALSISASTNVDLTKFKLVATQLSASYDLHCFNIQFSWVPSGTYKSWNFCIAANASALADLLRVKKSSSYMDN